MTYPPPPGPGYPGDGGYGQPQYPPQAGNGWGGPPEPPTAYPDQPAYGQPAYPDQAAYPDQQQYGSPDNYPSQPVSGPVSGGWGQPPVSVHPITAQPAYQPPPMLGMPAQAPAPQPPTSKTPIMVAVIVGVVALLGLGTLLVVSLSGKDKNDVADPKDTQSSTQASEAASSAEPTEDANKITDLTYSEFGKDWDSSASDSTATFINGWDYTDCHEFEEGTVLTDLGCEYAVELAFEAQDGDVKMSVFFLGMTDELAASGATYDIKDGDFYPRNEGFISEFSYGMWQAGYSSNITVLTVVTTTDAVEDAAGDAYLTEMIDDMTIAIDNR